MRPRSFLVRSGLLVPFVAVAAISISIAQEQPVPAVQPAPERVGEAVNIRAKDLKWERMMPDLGEKSRQIVILNVNPKTRATHLMIRSPQALLVPPHWHSSNETHTVLSGSFTVQVEDGEIVELEQGSFNYIPARKVHQAWMTPGQDGYATVLITVDGPWDVQWVQGPPTERHIGVRPPKAHRC